MARQRLDLREAAEVLGTTVDAVRKRVQRGSLDAEKGEASEPRPSWWRRMFGG
jgi:DNA-directed RNA polymerase specialized sigma24 family protein